MIIFPIDFVFIKRTKLITSSKLKILVSERFKKNYGHASIDLQGLAEGAVHDFVRQYRSDKRIAIQKYDRHVKIKDVLEIDLAGGPRMLASYSNDELKLLDMGGHEVVSRYSQNKFHQDMEQLSVAHRNFWPESDSQFFIRKPDKTAIMQYTQENKSDWIYFLEQEQENIFDNIVDEIIGLQPNDFFDTPFYIIGGPGTGKTCILLNILKFLFECPDLNLNTGIVLSTKLKKFIETSSGANLSQFQINFQHTSKLRNIDILLVDDPNKSDLLRASELSKQQIFRDVIIAFDPLQLDKSISDSDFEKIVKDFDADVSRLKDCYRQKENVGLSTKKVIDSLAESTPYLDKGKITTYKKDRESLTDFANNINFINPHGYVQYYENYKVKNLQYEVERILNNEWLMWDYYPGLLVVLYQYELTEEEKNVLAPLRRKKYIQTISDESIHDVKGLEFQHVFIFMKRTLFYEIQNGFSGTGRRIYNQRRLMRIPFSRARDSLVTFVIP